MPRKKKKKKIVEETKSEMTTIAISRTNQNLLNSMRRGFEDYNAIVTRLIEGQTFTYTEIISIDGELPFLHTCTIQLGEDAKCLNYWNGQNWKEISFEEANKLMKQPKPNVTLTREELYFILTHDIPQVRGKLDFEVSKTHEPLHLTKRLIDFVENQPSANTERRDS
jgi:hypothetical protein